MRRQGETEHRRFLLLTKTIFLFCGFTIKLPLISLDFAIDFPIFTMWLQTCGWTDGQTDG